MGEYKNTIGTTLKQGTTEAALTKMCSITKYPDMGGKPDSLDTTTMDDSTETSIAGVQKVGDFEFEALFDETEYTAMKASSGKAGFYSLDFANGSKYTWQGSHVVYETGAGVNEVRKVKININRTSAITWTKSA